MVRAHCNIKNELTKQINWGEETVLSRGIATHVEGMMEREIHYLFGPSYGNNFR